MCRFGIERGILRVERKGKGKIIDLNFFRGGRVDIYKMIYFKIFLYNYFFSIWMRY